ncbi:MAG: hypothetical protein KJ042_15550, partial [Deltaproteobacteria bacterium]|nr:hypothetical protein [Deltaproteobacteria bacterium]
MSVRAYAFWCLLVAIVAGIFAGCAGDDESGDSAEIDDGDDDASPSDDDAADDDASGDDAGGVKPKFDQERFDRLLDQAGGKEFFDFEPVKEKPAYNGYTRFTFSKDDMRCYDGTAAAVDISPGDPERVMFFMEGGGASWPGYNLAFQIEFLLDIGFKNRHAENPLRDWTIVYVPYCDNSIHAGDGEYPVGNRTVYHHGMRHTAASAALTARLFPNAKKVLVTGSSAGGFGTYIAWPMIKYVYPNAKTYVLPDSGVGFWDPSQPETWETIRTSWNLHIPEECTRCDGPIMTWLYDLYLEIDPQLRIGMFTAWHDGIISGWFLKMNKYAFEGLLRGVTDEIDASHPDRFNRFFIAGDSHTCYELLLPGGANYAVDGVSLYQWIDRLVNDDPAWDER